MDKYKDKCIGIYIGKYKGKYTGKYVGKVVSDVYVFEYNSLLTVSVTVLL